MTWIAGWNMPGYMPEAEPAEFDTWREAHGFIVGEVERAWDDGTDVDYLPAHTALHVATEDQPYAIDAGDGYVYWVEPAEPPIRSWMNAEYHTEGGPR